MSKTPSPRKPKPVSAAQRLTDLESRQADLERRIAELERRAAEQVPWTFPTDPAPVWPQYPNKPWIDSTTLGCPVCGVRWEGAMGYVCHNPGCPSRVTCGDPKPLYIGDPLPGSPGYVTTTCAGDSL